MVWCCKPIYRISTLTTFPVGNREKWLETRARFNTTPTSSMLCSYFKCGFTSWNIALHERFESGTRTAEKTNFFAERAKLHGTSMEPKARCAFESFLRFISETDGGFYKTTSNSGEISTVSLIQYGKSPIDKVELLSTPDCLLFFNDYSGPGLAVAEFKCPFKCVVGRKDQSVFTVVQNFLKEAPYGKEAAFIQAASYSLIHTATRFYTVFYFTDTVEEEYILVFTYFPSEKLYEQIFEAISASSDALKELSTLESTGGRSFRSPLGAQKTISKLMKKCSLDTPLIYDVHNRSIVYCSLDEESSDNGENSGPQIPGNPSSERS